MKAKIHGTLFTFLICFISLMSTSIHAYCVYNKTDEKIQWRDLDNFTGMNKVIAAGGPPACCTPNDSGCYGTFSAYVEFPDVSNSYDCELRNITIPKGNKPGYYFVVTGDSQNSCKISMRRYN